MKNNFKKIIASLLATTTMSVGMIGTSVNASTVDTAITNFEAPPGISGVYNPLPVIEDGIRSKSTDSSVYLNVNSSTQSVSVQTWGVSDTNWNSSGRNLTCNSYGSYTNSVTVYNGSPYIIKNMINENNYYLAGLKFSSVSTYDWSTVNGVWSPDYSYQGNVIVAG